MLRPAVIAALLTATPTVAAPPKPLPAIQRDAAGNRLESLPRLKAKFGDDAPRTLCTPAPRFCVRTVTGRFSGNSVVEILTAPGTAAIASLDYAGGGDRTELNPWPYVIRLAGSDAVLLGMTEDTTTGYSGGGGSSSTLNLLLVARARPGGKWTVRNVLTLPLSGYKMIRACFGEADMRARRQACHDEYNYDARLTLVPTTARGKPRFAIVATATTYPGDVSPDRDSLAAGPLKASDLVKRRDPKCSFRRILTANGAWDYLPDAPLPDCTNYTVP